VDDYTESFANRVLNGEKLSRAELLSLAESSQENPFDLLYWANRIRTENFGRAVKLCSIVAGKTGACSEDCKWCAQSAKYETPGSPCCSGASNSPARTEVEAIKQAAKEASQAGAASIGIVNSGRKPSEKDINDAVDAAQLVTSDNMCGDLQMCASLGELDDQTAQKLVAAGFTRYNHNLETSKAFYPKMVTTHKYEDRINCLKTAKKAGLSICCGGIFGLGETWQDRIDLAITLRDEIGPAVVPLNFLHPIEGTPLETNKPLEPMEILRIIAVFRFALPYVDIKIAGGREKNLGDLQSWIFYAGGTSFLIGNYLTTIGRPPEDDLRMISDLGLEIVRKLPQKPSKTPKNQQNLP